MKHPSDAVKRAHSSHAGRHISPSANPLPKGQACSTCKARKVKCDAALPACSACRRTANFEGRDPSLVVCQYGSKGCGGVKRKRPSKPRRRVSYASDDDYSPSSDDSMYLAPSSSRSRKARADSGLSASSSHSASSTPSLSAESSHSRQSTSTLVEPGLHDTTLPSLSVAPIYASLMSQSPLSYDMSSWAQAQATTSSMPLGSLQTDSFHQDAMTSYRSGRQDSTPPSSAPLTPPPMSLALPEVPAPFLASLAQHQAPSKTAATDPALLTPGIFDMTSSADAFNLSADPLADDLLFSMLDEQQHSSKGVPAQTGVGGARAVTPFLMTTTPGASFPSDSIFEWTTFDYFAPQQPAL